MSSMDNPMITIIIIIIITWHSVFCECNPNNNQVGGLIHWESKYMHCLLACHHYYTAVSIEFEGKTLDKLDNFISYAMSISLSCFNFSLRNSFSKTDDC